jgi:hypothetical protein
VIFKIQFTTIFGKKETVSFECDEITPEEADYKAGWYASRFGSYGSVTTWTELVD